MRQAKDFVVYVNCYDSGVVLLHLGKHEVDTLMKGKVVQ